MVNIMYTADLGKPYQEKKLLPFGQFLKGEDKRNLHWHEEQSIALIIYSGME